MNVSKHAVEQFRKDARDDPLYTSVVLDYTDEQIEDIIIRMWEKASLANLPSHVRVQKMLKYGVREFDAVEHRRYSSWLITYNTLNEVVVTVHYITKEERSYRKSSVSIGRQRARRKAKHRRRKGW